MKKKPLNISEEAAVQMPMKTVASLIALVAINSEGTISAIGNNAHWIRVTTAERNGLIGYFNPYTNNYEEISWYEFEDSLDRVAETPGNENAQRVLLTT